MHRPFLSLVDHPGTSRSGSEWRSKHRAPQVPDRFPRRGDRPGCKQWARQRAVAYENDDALVGKTWSPSTTKAVEDEFVRASDACSSVCFAEPLLTTCYLAAGDDDGCRRQVQPLRERARRKHELCFTIAEHVFGRGLFDLKHGCCVHRWTLSPARRSYRRSCTCWAEEVSGRPVSNWLVMPSSFSILSSP